MFDKATACTLTYSKIENSPKQTCYYFPNGYGASVINCGYGSSDGQHELCLLKGQEIHYIDDSQYCDVIGYLTTDQVLNHLHNISQFEDVK